MLNVLMNHNTFFDALHCLLLDLFFFLILSNVHVHGID